MATKLTEKTINNALAYYRRKLSTLKKPDGKFRHRQEVRMRARLRRAWKKQSDWIIENIADLPQFEQTAERTVRYISTKRFIDPIDDVVNNIPGNEDVVDAITVGAEASFKKGGKKMHRQFDMGSVGISFELINEPAIDYLRALETIHLSDAKGSISYTTKKRIRKILTDAAEKGLSYQETSKLIQAQGAAGVFSQARGELIAVREIGLAYGHGNRAMVDVYRGETGAIIEKEWITSADDLVTPECQANEDMGWIGFNEFFNNTGAQEAAPRSDHPRCRCDTGYREVDLNGDPI